MIYGHVRIARLAVRLLGWQMARPEPPRNTSADDEAAMPDADTAPDHGEPLSDELLNLIARTGLRPVNLAAEAHEWTDGQVARRGLPVVIFSPPDFRRSATLGFFGVSNHQASLHSSHRSALLRVAMLGRYRVDYRRDGRRGQPLTVACDGNQMRKAYHNRVVACPAEPLPREFARFFDPAWLLSGWQLAMTGQASVNGRQAIGVVARPLVHKVLTWAREETDPSLRIAVLLDAELGIVLRQISFVDDLPAVRFELRDVTDRSGEEPADFSLDPGPGIPLIESDGGPLHDLDLPEPVRAAGEAVTTVLGGVRSGLGPLSDKVTRIRTKSQG